MSTLELSGETFVATYEVVGTGDDALEMAQRICVEQTVEFPLDLIDREDITSQIVGRTTRIETVSEKTHRAVIEFPCEVVGAELTQLLNVLFGNISLLRGIKLVALDLPERLLESFRGPRFGRDGLRVLTGVERRPLVATALKPMGLSPRELATLAKQFASGGVDVIKDDHGLVDQQFCPFDERVQRCAEAVAEVNATTGRRCLYFANITGAPELVRARAERAHSSGAGGVMIAPGLAGSGTMAALAADDSIGLPILSHPAFQGDFTVSPSEGISHGVLYGQINRLAGADGVIFPSFGGRFGFSRAECLELTEGAARGMGRVKPAIPVPAGGMNLGRVRELIEFYGPEVMLLIGGDLHRHGTSLADACRQFVESVDEASGLSAVTLPAAKARRDT